jgi:hypothetical protein
MLKKLFPKYPSTGMDNLLDAVATPLAVVAGIINPEVTYP